MNDNDRQDVWEWYSGIHDLRDRWERSVVYSRRLSDRDAANLIGPVFGTTYSERRERMDRQREEQQQHMSRTLTIPWPPPVPRDPPYTLGHLLGLISAIADLDGPRIVINKFTLPQMSGELASEDFPAGIVIAFASPDEGVWRLREFFDSSITIPTFVVHPDQAPDQPQQQERSVPRLIREGALSMNQIREILDAFIDSGVASMHGYDLRVRSVAGTPDPGDALRRSARIAQQQMGQAAAQIRREIEEDSINRWRSAGEGMRQSNLGLESLDPVEEEPRPQREVAYEPNTPNISITNSTVPTVSNEGSMNQADVEAVQERLRRSAAVTRRLWQSET